MTMPGATADALAERGFLPLLPEQWPPGLSCYVVAPPLRERVAWVQGWRRSIFLVEPDDFAPERLREVVLSCADTAFRPEAVQASESLAPPMPWWGPLLLIFGVIVQILAQVVAGVALAEEDRHWCLVLFRQGQLPAALAGQLHQLAGFGPSHGVVVGLLDGAGHIHLPADDALRLGVPGRAAVQLLRDLRQRLGELIEPTPLPMAEALH